MSKFTGGHMLAIFVVGFGIVIGVNLYMASAATSTFNGVVVENSYVASQNYNEWLEQAREQDKLGWSARSERLPDGRLAITTNGVPQYATVRAIIDHPLGKHESQDIALSRKGENGLVSLEPLPQGRWKVRLVITSGDDRWTSLKELS